jgi:chitodextrinase
VATVLALFGSFGRPAPFAATTAPSNGLVGYWSFDESSGTTTVDSSPNGNTGTISGTGVTRVPGKIGRGALNFNGVNGKVSVPSSPSLNLTSSFTLTAWLRPASLSGYRTAVLKGSTSACAYWLQTTSNRLSSGFGTAANCSSYSQHVASSVNLQVNTWYHVAATFDNGANTFSYYVNGDLVYTATEMSAPVSTNEDLVFGQSMYADGNYTRWNGQMDEIRVYNRALSSVEVLDVFNDTGAASADVQAPTAPTGVSANAVSSTRINLSWTASVDDVGVAGYRVYRGSVFAGATTSPNFADTGLQPGTIYSYTVAAYDYTQNLSAESAPPATATTWPASSGDGVAPSVSLTGLASNAIVRGSGVTVNASSSDNVGLAAVQFLLDGQPLGQEDTVAPYSLMWNTTTVSDGMHQISARARDVAGNTAVSGSVSIRVDNLPPSGSITINGGANYTKSATVTLSLAATDVGSSVTEMRFSNGGTYSLPESFAVTKSWTLSAGNGGKTVSVQFKDASGAWSQGLSDTITYDSIAPTVSNIGSSDVGSSSATITWTSSEFATSQIEYGRTSYSQTSTMNNTLVTSHRVRLTALLPNTTYNYRVRSSDAAGNERVSANQTFQTRNVADASDPTVSLTQPANGATLVGTITVSAQASDDRGVAAVQFFLDNAALGAEDTTAPYQVTWNTGLAGDGTHSLFARARDSSGNLGTSTLISVTVDNAVDNQPPSVPANLRASVGSSTLINLSWAPSSDSTGPVSYQVFRSGNLVGTVSATSYPDAGLAPATTYTYTVRAVDGAGNFSLQSSPVTATTEAASSTGPFVYPLRLSADGRSLMDQGSRPFFMNGDTAWSLMAQLSQQDVNDYLSDRQQKGYNLVLVNLIEHSFATSAPATISGVQPFTQRGNFNTPNEAYFAHTDWVINKAAEKGIVVLLAPLYLGYNCSNEGWCAEVQASSTATMRAWGRYVGNRYKDFRNIIWLIGGDMDPSGYGLSAKVREFVGGLREYDTSHLISAHNRRGQSAMDVWPNEAWLDLNNVYTDAMTYSKALAEYNRSPFKPIFLLEAVYENENGSTPALLRSQAYSAVLSGATLGHLFGSCPIWNFGSTASFCGSTNWRAQLNSTGSRTLGYVGRLFTTRAFAQLIPDQSHAVLTAGYQSGSSYAATAITEDGSTAIAYLPSQRSVTINMARIAGTTVRAWWFNPGTAQSTLIGDFPATGSRSFTPPSGGDWVLVLDNQALGLAAPGS